MAENCLLLPRVRRFRVVRYAGPWSGLRPGEEFAVEETEDLPADGLLPILGGTGTIRVNVEDLMRWGDIEELIGG